MATQYFNLFGKGKWSTHRIETGAPVAADAALSSTFPRRTAPINTAGYDTLRAVVDLEGGAVPTASIQWCSYDSEIDDPVAAGSFHVIKTDASLASGSVVDVTTYGHRIFARISAVTGNPTQIRIRVTPGTAA